MYKYYFITFNKNCTFLKYFLMFDTSEPKYIFIYKSSYQGKGILLKPLPLKYEEFCFI